MSNCNLVSIPIVKKLCLAPAYNNCNLDPKDVLAYKQFTRSVQQLTCQTQPNIIQTVSKLSYYNIKPID